MDGIAFTFLVISIAGSFPLLLLVRNLIRLQPLPADTDLFFRTGTRATEFIIHDRLVENALESQYGQSAWVDLGNGQMTSSGIVLQGAAADLISWKIPFEIRIDGGKWTNLSVGSKQSHIQGGEIDTKSFDADKDRKQQPHINSIYLGNTRSPIHIHGLRIGRLIVDANCASPWIVIYSSQIQSIHFKKSAVEDRPMVELSDCWINLIKFEEQSCGDIRFHGGGVKNIHCVAPSSENPFLGNVIFSNNTQLVVEGGQGLFGGEQDRRSLRSHLHALENSDADRYVFAFEKRIERKLEGTVVQFLSAAYDALSFYGNSPGRVLAWLLALLLYSAALVFAFDGAALPDRCIGPNNGGWVATVCQMDIVGRIYRAIVFTLQHTANPFGVFSERSLIQATSIWSNFWVVVQSIFSLILVALLVLSFRRKFRAS